MARKKSLDEGRVPREEILQRASLLFYERGYGATSIRDIAEAVGLSSSTMYHHFANKQDVLYAIVDRFMSDFVDATVPVLRDTTLSPAERIRRTVRRHIEISDDRRWPARHLRVEQLRSPAAPVERAAAERVSKPGEGDVRVPRQPPHLGPRRAVLHPGVA